MEKCKRSRIAPQHQESLSADYQRRPHAPENSIQVELRTASPNQAIFNGEIQELLKSGIIQKSRSPYNNPIWVVDKKGTDETGGRKMRLVLDFRKLN